MPVQPLPRRTLVWRAGVPLAGVWLVCTALNLFKGVHIDDTAHLAIADHIAHDPLHPMAAEVFWQDRPAPASELNQPHLFFYALAGLLALGGSLTSAHLAMSLFTGLALWATYRTVLRSSGDVTAAVSAATLLGLGPALAPSQNLMTDVPLLGFTTLALAALIGPATDRATDPAGPRIAFAAAMIGVACLVKYTGLVLLPVLVWWVWRRRRRHLWTISIPLAMLAAWSAFNVWDDGEIHLLGRRISVSDDTPNALAAVGLVLARGALYLITLGALCPFTLAFAARIDERMDAKRVGLIAAIALPVITVGGQVLAAFGPEVLRGETVIHSLLRGLFFLNGLLVVALAFGSARRRWDAPEVPLLTVWVTSLALFIVVLSPFVAVRHVLLVLPPLLALLLADPEARPQRRALRAALGLSLVIGLGVGVADWRIADAYRTLPARLSAEVEVDGSRVFYLGHWGFQHYAEEAGWLPYVPGRTVLEPGDRLVHPLQVDAPELEPADRARLALVRTVTLEAGPLDLFRTVTPRLGYYSVWHGLPWTLSLAPLERVEVYEVRPSPGQGAERPDA